MQKQPLLQPKAKHWWFCKLCVGFLMAAPWEAHWTYPSEYEWTAPTWKLPEKRRDSTRLNWLWEMLLEETDMPEPTSQALMVSREQVTRRIEDILGRPGVTASCGPPPRDKLMVHITTSARDMIQLHEGSEWIYCPAAHCQAANHFPRSLLTTYNKEKSASRGDSWERPVSQYLERYCSGYSTSRKRPYKRYWGGQKCNR